MMYGPPLLLEERYSQACLGYYPDHTDGIMSRLSSAVAPAYRHKTLHFTPSQCLDEAEMGYCIMWNVQQTQGTSILVGVFAVIV